jgi:signal transduction histidine kinase
MARLVAYFLAIALITISLVGYVAYAGARNALEAAVLRRLSAVATLQEGELRRWVDHHTSDVQLLAGSPEIRRLATRAIASDSIATDDLRRYLLEALGLEIDIEEVMVLAELGGRVVVSTERSHEGEYRARDRFFVLGRHQTHVATVYPSTLTYRPTLTISTPLESMAGDTIGVLAAHLNLARIDRIITGETGVALSGETYLVDRYNAMVSSERFGAERFPRGVHTAGIDAAVAGEDGAGLYDNYAGVSVLGAYRWIEDLDIALLVEVPRAEAFAPAGRIAKQILLGGLPIVAMLALGMFLLARQIAAPILAVTDAAVQVSRGDLGASAPVVTRDETGVLAQTFNQMTARLRQLYDDLKREIVARTKAEAEVRELNLGLERRVRERTAELNATNAELQSFAYTVSHDLRSPLRAIHGFSQALVEDFGERLDDDARRYVERIQESTTRMGDLIDALLALSRVTRHRMQFEEVDLTEQANAIASELRAETPERRVIFRAAEGLTAWGDPRLVRLVLENLLSNAWKFTGRSEQACVQFEAVRNDGDGLAYCVRDNGVGFSMEYAGQLFGPFQRLHRQDEFDGTGIGLATVHRIIQRHHGEVWCEAEEGKGATFYFTLGAQPSPGTGAGASPGATGTHRP